MDTTLLITAQIDINKIYGLFGTVKVHTLLEGTISNLRWASIL